MSCLDRWIESNYSSEATLSLSGEEKNLGRRWSGHERGRRTWGKAEIQGAEMVEHGWQDAVVPAFLRPMPIFFRDQSNELSSKSYLPSSNMYLV